MRYWLIKSEPDTYSIEALRTDKKTAWEGVRNYQARNHMQAMKKGDLVLFYHSSTKPMGVAGLAQVVSEAHPDESQFTQGDYFEPKATRQKPLWYCVDVAFKEKFGRLVTLDEIKQDPALEGMPLRAQGSRLSVQPVSDAHFARVRSLAARSQ
jgi:predicted RNA-binding protein with PUA-like domain